MEDNDLFCYYSIINTVIHSVSMQLNNRTYCLYSDTEKTRVSMRAAVCGFVCKQRGKKIHTGFSRNKGLSIILFRGVR